MRRVLSLLLLVLAVVVVRPAFAPPPISTFPAVVLPGIGSSAPLNARVWAFGAGAPAIDRVDFVVRIGGAPVAAELSALGCCAISARVTTATSGEASARVRAGTTELTTQFTFTRTVDVTSPELTSARALDDDGAKLTIGADGTDDLGLAGFVARVDGQVRNVVPPGLLLPVTVGGDRCVEVTAIDLVGQESAPTTVCGTAAPDAGVPPADAGVPSADAGSGGEDDGGCSAVGPSTTGLWALLAAAVLWRTRRTRAVRPARAL